MEIVERQGPANIVAMSAMRDKDLASQAQQVIERERSAEVRRRDAELHQYKEIWTKEPHGGPYKKVRNCAERCLKAPLCVRMTLC